MKGSTTGAVTNDRGIALLGAMVVVLVLSLLGAALLNVAGQDARSAAAGRELATAQQLADAAGEVVTAWFHTPQRAPLAVASRLTKQNVNAAGSLSYFDQTGRSQFTGTADRPDILLDRTTLLNGELLNSVEAGLFHQLADLGTIQEIKLYGPSRPGLLCTIDVTVGLRRDESVRQSVRMQMGALDLPAVRAAVQTGQSLGTLQLVRESPVEVHWGDLKVNGDLILRRTDELPVQTAGAPVTGQSYGDTAIREDRWTNIKVGGEVQTTQLSSGQQGILPLNVQARQNPSPGVRLDLWSYDQLKRLAMQHGSYFAIDRAGLLYPGGHIEPGRGLAPEEALQSRSAGDQRGLVFIDTMDRTPPRPDNLGTVTLSAPYLEGVVVMQGHVILKPGASNQAVPVLSPPTGGSAGPGARVPVQLPGVQLNGALYAAGNIILAASTKVFGAVTAEGAIVPEAGGAKLEVWYDHQMSQGLFRGVPVVYRAPGTWLARY